MKGLYIHIPFCKSKCLYCGFNSCSNYDENILEKYLFSIIEIAPFYPVHQIDTIFIGGGTPTIIPPRIFDSFLNSLSKVVNMDSIREFTVEVNPESITKEHLSVFQTYKVSRISIGAQSFNDNVLKFLGRVHYSKDIFGGVECIRKHHPSCKLNLDIMFDIPVIENDIQNTLCTATSLEPEHISAYNYSFDTAFLNELSCNIQNTDFYRVKEYLEKKGYEKYEISNFARNGNVCIHNKKYWSMDEYIGLGVSAHSMFELSDRRIRFSFTEKINEFIRFFKIAGYEFVYPEVMLKEDVVFGLRLTKGIDFAKILKKYNYPLSEFKKKIEALVDEELLCLKENVLCLSERGELFLDYVQAFLWEVL